MVDDEAATASQHRGQYKIDLRICSMKKKTITYIVFTLLLLLFVSLFWNYKQYRDIKELPTETKEVTVVKYIEKKDSLPAEKEERVIGKISVPVKSARVGSDSTDYSPVGSEKVRVSYPDMECSDSIEIEITQKVYSDDSTYTAYVSGYKPKLDSIFVNQKVIDHTIINTRTLKEKEFRRFNIGLIGGYGYGFQSKTFEPFVGIGFTWNFFK